MRIASYTLLWLCASFFVACEVEPDSFFDQSSEYNETVYINSKDTAVCMLPQNGYQLTLLNTISSDSVFWYFPAYGNQTPDVIGTGNELSTSFNDTGTVRIQRFLNGFSTETEVKLFDCLQTVYVANTFTPDGDGLNDVWQPLWSNVSEISWKIRSEQGQTILHSEYGELVAWDGTWNGNPAAAGHYQYQIWYKTIYPGDERRKSGWLRLYRNQ